MSDITGGKAKLIMTMLFDLFWSIGLILLPAISIFFNSWTNLYVVISMPTIALVLLHRYLNSLYKISKYLFPINVLRLIPDSPRWLISKGKLVKAKEILIKSARINGRSIPDDLDHQLKLQAMQSM